MFMDRISEQYNANGCTIHLQELDEPDPEGNTWIVTVWRTSKNLGNEPEYVTKLFIGESLARTYFGSFNTVSQDPEVQP